ncbi:hypothetical protein TNCV_3087371 [Trichonephila clavipes]|uniref:Uncharacterized protein n=1 Tax=Trichonephila clavipes TaxID=2585209 RepID=A0A8X6RGD8_TRICX|nr:hypothetical protein TNCV_3087371 [Trichonephila clavipes]
MRQRTPERRNNSLPRNHSRNRSFSRSSESGCSYHRKFQERAKKCNSPSSYEKTNPATSNCNYLLAAAYFVAYSLKTNPTSLFSSILDLTSVFFQLRFLRKGMATIFHNYQPLMNLRSTFMIIEADFLYNFNISPDLRNRKLIDNATKLSTNCKLVSSEVHSIKLVSGFGSESTIAHCSPSDHTSCLGKRVQRLSSRGLETNFM